MAKAKKTANDPEETDFDEDEVRVRPKKAAPPPLELTADGLRKTVAASFDALRAARGKLQTVCLAPAHVAPAVDAAMSASGDIAAFTSDSGEATALAAVCGSLLLDTGAPDRAQSEAMRAAVARANMSSHPWVLVPAGIGTPPQRTYLARELMRRFPAVIAGQAAELLVLAGIETGGGAQQGEGGEDAIVRDAQRLAQVTRAVVIVCGKGRYAICADNAPAVAIARPSGAASLAYRGTSVCGAVAAAFLAALGGKERLPAAVAAAAAVACAEARAAESAKGRPAAFAAAFTDALDAATGADTAKRAQISILPKS